MIRRKLAFSPPSPDVQKDVNDFLDMGHANGCWCSSVARSKARAGTSSGSAAVDGLQALQVAAEIYTPKSQEPILNKTIYVSHAPQDLPELLDDIAGDFSEDDAVIVTPSSEGTSSGFEELLIIEAVSPPGFDGDEWVAVTPCLRARRPSSLPPPQTVSNELAQATELPVATSSLSLLPSPPQTPFMLPHQAGVSDAESETD
jgi:hypothetical protein